MPFKYFKYSKFHTIPGKVVKEERYGYNLLYIPTSFMDSPIYEYNSYMFELKLEMSFQSFMYF